MIAKVQTRLTKGLTMKKGDEVFVVFDCAVVPVKLISESGDGWFVSFRDVSPDSEHYYHKDRLFATRRDAAITWYDLYEARLEKMKLLCEEANNEYTT